jgi:GH15 family glucan-1,4-alpha-glucosidase
MTSLDLGVIGNSNVAALIDRAGRVVWMSWPRIDGDPVFCSLLDGETPEDGYFSLEFDEETVATEQSYERNTAILRTVHRAASGAAFAVTDFAPRFRQFGRMHRPPMIIRRVDRLEGLCVFAPAFARAWITAGTGPCRSPVATTSGTSRRPARSG